MKLLVVLLLQLCLDSYFVLSRMFCTYAVSHSYCIHFIVIDVCIESRLIDVRIEFDKASCCFGIPLFFCCQSTV